MSEMIKRTQEKNVRRRRIRRIKRVIIMIVVAAMLVPIIFCVMSFCKMSAMQKQVDSMQKQLESIQQSLEAQAVAVQSGDGALVSSAAGAVLDKNSLEVLENEKSISGNDAQDSDINEQSGGRKIYLTFDDGPSANTNEILDILDRYGVKATFFVVGKTDEVSIAAYKRIVEDGHTLGMHSYSHCYESIYESLDNFSEDFIKLQDYLYSITGVYSRYYRFPGGSSNNVSKVPINELIDYLNEQRVTYFDWNISSGDGSSASLSVQTIVDNCTGNLDSYHRGMILFHDSTDKTTTVEALPIIIEKIQAMEDTQIVPITESTEPIQHIIKE